MNTVFYEYSTIDDGTIKVLIAPTSKDGSKVRFNVAHMVDGKCKANVCTLMTKEVAELFVHHLTSTCASELPKCECGEPLGVL